ncbi:hypothetical protein HAX54_052294, partial [Datura stramonium]|nr:hypothetical protein [Datura stramonium]
YKFKKKGCERNGTGSNGRSSTTCNILAEERNFTGQDDQQFIHGQNTNIYNSTSKDSGSMVSRAS